MFMSLMALLLTACGGGDGGSPSDPGAPGACTFFEPYSTTAGYPDSGCTDCSVADVQRAIDADLGSAATVTAGYHPATGCNLLGCQTPAQGIEVRATAPSGVAYPPGNLAGAWVHFPANGSWTAQIATYLNGQLQDGGHTGPGVSTMGDDQTFLGIQTGKPFDAVAIYLTHDADEGTMMDVKELCSDAPAFR
jgi:hypothetical protein